MWYALDCRTSQYDCTLLVSNADQDCMTLFAASVSAPFPAPASQPAPEPAAVEVERPRKKLRKKQEYVPGVGTANYAFIIVLYQVFHPLHVLRSGNQLQLAAQCQFPSKSRISTL